MTGEEQEEERTDEEWSGFFLKSNNPNQKGQKKNIFGGKLENTTKIQKAYTNTLVIHDFLGNS